MKRVKRKKTNLESDLNINALMDVLTVLLFFLIQSFSLSTTMIEPPKGVRVPSSSSQQQPEEAVNVSLSANELRANNTLLISLQDGIFHPKDLDSDERTIPRLRAFLDKELKKKNKIYEGAGDLSFLPQASVIIQADKALPFGAVKNVLHTVAVAGYKDYQFIVKNDAK